MLETTTVVYSSRNGSSKLYPTATVETGVQTVPESPKPMPKPTVKSNTDQLCLDGLAPEMKGLCKAIMLALCYAASIGGTGTLTGTGPNVVITGQLASFFPNQDSVTFATWMAFAVPPMILCTIVCWLLLLSFFVGWKSIFNKGPTRQKSSSDGGITSILRKRYEELVAPGEKRGNLLNWGIIQKKFPWSVIILLGGGYAMADGVDKSHLGSWLGCSMKDAVGHLSVPVITFIMTSMVCAVTQIAANSAVATIFIPVLVSMAGILNVNPLYFLLPTTVAASYAYVLPVSTPPNAVVFEFKMMALKDMMVPGAILSFLCVVIIMLNTFTVADWLFNLNEMPHWAINATMGASRC
uniref:Solute carrier family 13 member 5 n=1 Tax=Romanomermis culicivorax TaxID=13658 RepID=A0A915J3G0_ROMCU